MTQKYKTFLFALFSKYYIIKKGFVLIFINLCSKKKHKAMKKTLLSILLSLSCVISYGQITVTHMDMMFVGDEYYQGKDDNPSIILGTPGANKIWNFSFPP